MLEKLKEIIADQLNVDADSITAESRFKEDLEADSLDLFELVMALEEEYGVEIPSEDLEKILTVQDRKSTRLNSSHNRESRMPSSA